MVSVYSIGEWIKQNENTQFFLWVYRRGYTPYEMDKRFIDQSHFENSVADTVRIVEIVNLHNGDYLLGTQSYCEIDDEYLNSVEYYKLSEVRLARKIKNNGELYDNDTR